MRQVRSRSGEEDHSQRVRDGEGKEVFEAALGAVRYASSYDESVAFASEVDLDEASANGRSDDEDYGAEGSASDNTKPEDQGPGKPK